MSGQYQERKEYFKQYREKNKERLQQERHDYYEENKDRIKEYSKQWKQDNPSMVWLQKQEYYEKNKDKINEYRRRKYAEKKEPIPPPTYPPIPLSTHPSAYLSTQSSTLSSHP